MRAAPTLMQIIYDLWHWGGGSGVCGAGIEEADPHAGHADSPARGQGHTAIPARDQG